MSVEKKEKELRYLIPMQDLPFIRRQKFSFYDDVLKEFMESNLKYAEVKETGGRKPITIALVLREKLKKRNIQGVRVLTRSNKIYLAKIE